MPNFFSLLKKVTGIYNTAVNADAIEGDKISNPDIPKTAYTIESLSGLVTKSNGRLVKSFAVKIAFLGIATASSYTEMKKAKNKFFTGKLLDERSITKPKQINTRLGKHSTMILKRENSLDESQKQQQQQKWQKQQQRANNKKQTITEAIKQKNLSVKK